MPTLALIDVKYFPKNLEISFHYLLFWDISTEFQRKAHQNINKHLLLWLCEDFANNFQCEIT